MRKETALFALVLASLVACSSSKSPAPGPNAQIDLATCVPGVWLDTSHSCTCVGLFATAECGAADCLEANALVLAADGTSSDLILRRSASRATFSAVGGSGAVLAGHWTLTTGAQPTLSQTFDATKTSYESGVECSSSRLVRVGKSGYDRAPSPLAKAVLAPKTANTWKETAYQ